MQPDTRRMIKNMITAIPIVRTILAHEQQCLEDSTDASCDLHGPYQCQRPKGIRRSSFQCRRIVLKNELDRLLVRGLPAPRIDRRHIDFRCYSHSNCTPCDVAISMIAAIFRTRVPVITPMLNCCRDHTEMAYRGPLSPRGNLFKKAWKTSTTPSEANPCRKS